MGQFIRHGACDKCGSSDANAQYEDGSWYCWACRKPTKADGDVEDTEEFETKERKGFLEGSYQDIPKRKLREETCRKYGYSIGEDCQIANYYNHKRTLVAQKIRKANKKFSVTGDGKSMPLFGQHLWTQGKSVVITEGEIDALSIAQAFECKWPVVSLPNGAPSAATAIGLAYEWLDGFEKIILCFDADTPGREATEAVASMLPAGKAYVMALPTGFKDANEVLVAQGPAPLTQAYWQASLWRPDGILAGSEITLERLKAAQARGYSLPYPVLDEKLEGIRERELLLLTAGSGIGKSTLARELAYDLRKTHGLTIGNVYLEESVEKTAQGYVAIDNNVPLGKLRKDTSLLTDAQWQASLDTVINEGMFFYDHFGSLDSDRLIAKLRYMRQVLKCHFVILDHISIVISGQESSSEGERRDIDRFMTKLRSLIEETGLGIIAIVHLKQPEGKAHEEGGRVTLSHLRGSGSLKQLSDVVVALERDQQDEDTANQCQIRILKDRENGSTGPADTLEYMKDTGRLVSIDIATKDLPF